MSFSNDYENYQLNILGGVIINPQTGAKTFVALFTADPTETGSVANEVVGGSYARVSLDGAFTSQIGTTGIAKNTAEILFVTSTGDWGTITHFAVCQAGVGGVADIMMVGVLDIPKAIPSGKAFKFDIDGMTIQVD